jgi:leader peptidase (prepilin peptidase) / N-methyltransferase
VPRAVTALAVVTAAVLGGLVGVLVNRAAGRFPWPPPERSWRSGAGAPSHGGASAPRVRDRAGKVAVRRPVVELGTAALFALVALRFGASWELPAFLFLAGVGVLLTVIDLQHRLLPDRIVLPSIAAAAVLLLVAALPGQEWATILRACVAAAVLFAVFLVMALIAPSGMGWGDVKLAPLVGLYLGWIGWGAVVVGAAAGFVVQAAVALVLLAGRRIGLRGELPFGPAMLVGAAVAIGWSDALLG